MPAKHVSDQQVVVAKAGSPGITWGSRATRAKRNSPYALPSGEVAKGKRRGRNREAVDDLASADTTAIEDSRDPDAAVPTARKTRGVEGPDAERRPRGLQLRRGDEVARFIVVEKIGEGGMASVYVAYDPRLDRRVALKLMRPDASEHESPQRSRRRLLREAQALARLSHPNVVVVHEVDEVQGQVYVAMEYVAGGTLRSWIEDRSRTWQAVVSIYCSAGRGLAAAHEAGLVHRDFKPENVLVGESGRVRVTDFGLVGTTDGLSDSRPPVDRRGRFPTAVPLSSETEPHGVLMGTPGYVAPELLQGRPADERSDQFSFCVSLFEALHGEKPFEGTTAVEMASNAVEGRLRRAPERSDVPEWLDKVIRRGLSSDPAERYPSMVDLVAALEADPIAARRKRLRTLGAALGFAALAALAVFGFLRSANHGPRPCADARQSLEQVWNEASKREVRAAFEGTGLSYAADTAAHVAQLLDDYADAWTAMRTEACEATHVRGEQSEAVMDARMRCLDRRLGELEAYVDVLVNEPDRATVERAVDGASDLVAISACADVEALSAIVQPPEDPSLRARSQALLERIDRVQALSRAGKFQTALKLAAPLVEDARKLDWPHTLAVALAVLAELQQEKGLQQKAEDDLLEALPLAGEAHDDYMVATLHIELLGVVGQELARHKDALLMLPSAEAAIARAGNPPSLRGRYEQALGLVFDGQGQYEKALEHYRKALALLRIALPANAPDIAATLNDIALILDLQGHHEEALRDYEQSLSIEERAFGEHHPRVARTLNNLAIVLGTIGDNDAALRRYARALEIWRSAYGNNHRMVAITVLNMGVVYQATKKYGRARKAYEEAIQIWTNAKGRDRAYLANAFTNLGDLYETQGQCKKALGYYERGLATWEEVVGADHPDIAYALVGLGSCTLKLGNARRAVPFVERALDLRTKHRVDASDIAEAEFLLARALWADRGERKRASALAERARNRYLAEGEPAAKALSEVTAWLTAHGESRNRQRSRQRR